VEYQRIKLVWHGLDWLCPGASTAACVPLGVWVVWNVVGRGWCGVVFGALLGPEATGPFCSNAGGHLLVFLLFLQPALPVTGKRFPRLWGLWWVGCG
jgi:hypothetical protein